MGPIPVRDFIITPHAKFEMRRRKLEEETIRQVLSAPEQRVDVRRGRIVLQSRILMGDPARMYLIRVVVDVDRQPAEVVTVYRTSKVSKYWEEKHEGRL